MTDVVESETVADVADALADTVGVDGPVIRHTEPPWDGGMAAEVRGVLELDGDCLYLSSRSIAERYPILWPAGTTWDPSSRSVVTPVDELLPVGGAVSGGGGFLDVDSVGRFAGPEGEALASRCLDNTFGEIAVFNNTATAVRAASTDGLSAAARLIEIAGVPSGAEPLPAASAISLTATIIDDELCLGFVRVSRPPQCDGIMLDGLDAEGWGEEESGVHWGERHVTVTWPRIGEVVSVLDQGPPEPRPGRRPMPPECDGASGSANAAVNAYAEDLGPQIYGGLWVADNGVVVLHVAADPEPHRAAMAPSEVCVVAVEHTEAALIEAQPQLDELVADPGSGIEWASPQGPGGRVNVGVIVADGVTLERIAAAVDDPTKFRVVPLAEIVG